MIYLSVWLKFDVTVFDFIRRSEEDGRSGECDVLVLRGCCEHRDSSTQQLLSVNPRFGTPVVKSARKCYGVDGSVNFSVQIIFEKNIWHRAAAWTI